MGSSRDWVGDRIDRDVNLQSWTRNGSRGYWITGVTGARPTRLATETDSPGRRQRLDDLHGEELELLTRRASNFAATDTGIDDSILSSNWMRRTGWAGTFKGANRALLQRLSDPPHPDGSTLSLGQYGDLKLQSCQRDERQLLSIGRATDRFFDRCDDTAGHTDHSVRCWLRGQAPDRPYRAPFELPARKTTRLRYRGLWKRLTYFVFRLYRLHDTARRELLVFEFTEEQQRMLKQTWENTCWACDDNAPSDDATQKSSSPLPSYASSEGSRTPRDSDGAVMPALRATRSSRDVACAEQAPHSPVRECQSSVGYPTDLEWPASDSSDASEYNVYDRDECSRPDKRNISETRSELSEDGLSAPSFLVIQYRALNLQEVKAWIKLTIYLTELFGGHTKARLVDDNLDVHSNEEKLADVVGQLAVFFCKEQFTDSRSSSTLLVYFSGVLGSSWDGLTFRRPGNYTPSLSALIYCVRVVLLEETLPRLPHPYAGWEARPRVGQLERLNMILLRFGHR